MSHSSRSISLPEIVITPSSSDIYQSAPLTPHHSKKRLHIGFVIGIIVVVLICSGAVGYFIYSPLKHKVLSSSISSSITTPSDPEITFKNRNSLPSSNNMTVNTSDILNEMNSNNDSNVEQTTTYPVDNVVTVVLRSVVTSTSEPITVAPVDPTSTSTVTPTSEPITIAPVDTTSTSASISSLPNLCGKIPYSLSTAYQQYPNLRPAIDTLELYTIATWYTDNNPSALQEVQTLMQSCSSTSLPVIVVYGLPNKDCSAGYSNMGSNKNTNDYITWLNNLVEATQHRQAVYILEPDALGLFAQGNSCAQTSGYIENIQHALEILSKTNSYIYLDIAHWALLYDDEQSRAIAALVQMDPKKILKGISLNVSNYRPTSEMSFLCNIMHNLGLETGRNLHCAIDTSRNNNLVSNGGDWCNNQDAGIGMPPMKVTDPNLSYIDFFLWVKIPGESDGYCHNGPSAGQFSVDLFSKLWNQSYFVKQLHAQTI